MITYFPMHIIGRLLSHDRAINSVTEIGRILVV